MTKIKKPKLSNSLEITYKIDTDEKKLYDYYFKDINLTYYVEFNSCIFEKCTFDSDFKNSSFIDCIFRNCDFSNTDFSNSLMQRVELHECKLVGSDMDKCIFKDVLINKSLLNYISFGFSKFINTIFLASNINDSSFINTKYEDAMFDNCIINSINFLNANLSTMDISSSIINSLLLNGNELKGIICDEKQAIEFAKTLGIIVKES